MNLELIIFIIIVSSITGIIIGSQRGETGTGFIYGFFLGPLGILLTYFNTGIRCPYCMKRINPKSLRCPKCLSDLTEAKMFEGKETIICHNCGIANPDDFKHCRKCGIIIK